MELNVESDKLMEMLRDFHRVTRVRVSLYASDCRKIMSYPQESNPFCTLMHRPETHEACAASNNQAFQTCIRTRSTRIYTCHAGLTEVMVPLIDENAIIGYVVFGQISNIISSAELLKRLQASAQQYGLPTSSCESCLSAIQRRSTSEVQSMARLLEACAYFMIYNDFIRLHKNNFAQNLDAYLDAHLQEKITVDTLCKTFLMGRTTFYERVRISLNTSIHQYIRQKRLARARTLLTETLLPLEEIAILTGFSEPGYFSRVFREQNNCTPNQYRRQQRRR